jgi:Cdc6-like AAA superfamily ATPase
MSSKFDLRRIMFGNDDAERDAKQGFLSKVFLKTALYDRIKADQCELVIGRKGAGKSATCLILKSAFESEGMKVALLTPESLSQQKIQALQVNAINKEELYLQTWKYVLLVKVAFEFIDLFNKLKVPNLHKLNDDLKAVRDFLKKKGEIENDFGSNLSGLFKIFSKVSLSFGGFEGSLEANHSKSDQDLMDALARFETRLKKLLDYLNDTEIVILIDKVDEVWDDTKESKFMVSGLLRATHILNESLPMVKIMVFLRSDIFDALKFHDIDKLNSLAERLKWFDTDLKQLIENRVRVSANLDSSQRDENLWEKVFEKTVKEQDSFKYIVSRTLKRPRETIQFCNRALRIAQDSQHEKISADDILSAEIQYSAEKLRDLASEFLVQYSYLDGLLGVFQGFKPNFTRQELEFRYAEAKDRLEKLYLDLQSLSIEGIIQILYNIGFLGAEIDSAYVFFYNMPNLTLPQQERYVIHPAFHAALGVQERVVVLNDFQKEKVFIQVNSMAQNIGGLIGRGDQVYGDRTVIVGRSVSFEREEIMELLVRLSNLVEQSDLSRVQINKALVRLEIAVEEVKEAEPDKELVAKTVQRALKTIQEKDSSIQIDVRSLARIQPVLEQLSRWLGVSSSFFDIKSN